MTTAGPVLRHAPRIAILLPVALLLHQAEEWFGGFPEWVLLATGSGITPQRFLLINAVGFLLFLVGTLAAFLDSRMAWIVVSLAALVGFNALLHSVATVVVGSYSPGTATGLLLNLPLSVAVLRSSAATLPLSGFIGAVVLGVLLHGLATVTAYG